MIRYALTCEKRHEFEVWFNNSADYDKQRKRGLVTCPSCDSSKVEKALMAPQLGAGTKKKRRSQAPAEIAPAPSPSVPAVADTAPVMMSPQESEFRSKLRELRDHLVKNADNVGEKFPEEARKIHYGESEHRSIYGVASPDDAKSLHEEGIDFYPIPSLPEDRN